MKMKGIIVAVGLAVAASTATAQDQTFAFGNVGTSQGNAYFNSSFVTHAMGSFMDIFTFSLLAPPIPAWDGLGTIADQPKVDGSNIINLSASIWKDFGPIGVDPSDSLFTPLPNTTPDYITGGGELPAGSYYFKISGEATGPSPSAYTYTASVSPVPEPGSYAMMLAGLGLMGLIATRRNSRQG